MRFYFVVSGLGSTILPVRVHIYLHNSQISCCERESNNVYRETKKKSKKWATPFPLQNELTNCKQLLTFQKLWHVYFCERKCVVLQMFVFRVCLDTTSPRADIMILVIIITTPDSCFYSMVNSLFYLILQVSVEPMACSENWWHNYKAKWYSSKRWNIYWYKVSDLSRAQTWDVQHNAGLQTTEQRARPSTQYWKTNNLSVKLGFIRIYYTNYFV